MHTKSLPLAYVWYPLVVLLALVFHHALEHFQSSILVSTYVPVIFSAFAITLLEMFFPYRKQWHPDKKDIFNDALFMMLVQVVLPQCLVFLVGIILIGEVSWSMWPNEWPLWLQVIAMIVLADFFRYWLHVASHNTMPLWQLHAVHHSPKKLYWFNVGRFHPLEKAIQFSCDALPFILLGIDERVLALYFVFYATNGYFQHSNVCVRLGWLNYVISGPELHRWHHSQLVHESNRNYGNNIILWDLLFGTYYLPKQREVGDLGLKNNRYPESFFSQLKTPFILRLESANLPMVSYREIAINALLRVRFEFQYLFSRTRMLNATRNPRKHQLQVLRQIVRSNASSRYGREHNFAQITTFDDFISNCPINTYESLAPYNDLENAAQQGLTTETPSFYQVTSGTLGKPKFISVTPTGMANIISEQKFVAVTRYLSNPGTFSGKTFAIVSPAIEGHTPSGISYGSASGLLYQNMPAMARTKYVVPYEVFKITDYNAKYFLLALFALADARVTLLATANTSTLVRLLAVINEHVIKLLSIIETGEIHVPDWDQPLHPSIIAAIKPQPQRAKALQAVWEQNKHISFSDLWPHIQSLVTWTGGSCGIPLTALKKEFPRDIKISEVGYVSSEFRGTITIEDNLGVPTFLNHLFEFVTVADWDGGNQQIKRLDELERGEKYYVIVTTINGLYRYFMNDIVTVTDFVNKTPTLQFIQKGRGVTNITGEKLYEGHVLEAITRMHQELGVEVLFHQWLADEEESRYHVYLEVDSANKVDPLALATCLEAHVCALNIEYQQKRASNRLLPLHVHVLRPGTSERVRQHYIENGQREGQLKILTLLYAKEVQFPYHQHLLLDINK